ncbi:MAG TPA: Rieske 2Fe-2S domain-containing protein [Oscillatoriaceae cyanobacterium]
MAVTTELENAVERLPLKRVGERSANALHKTVLRSPWLRRAADVLHGTWLGHGLHPALTDFAIGAWFAGGGFDLVGALADSESARWAGDRLAETGFALAIPTALSGLTDYTATSPENIRPATLHALLNTTSFALYGMSVVERRWGNRTRGLAYSWAAQGLMLASAWIGGELVEKLGMAVDHGQTFDGPRDWFAILPESQLREGVPQRVEFDGKGILLVRHGDEIHAIAAVCSHYGGPLEEGTIKDDCVQCPWHDSVFDLRDGHVVHGPATFPMQRFDVRVNAGKIQLRLPR